MTADGEVVGIVTGILNPTEQRVFVGIGFAVPIENAAAGVGHLAVLTARTIRANPSRRHHERRSSPHPGDVRR